MATVNGTSGNDDLGYDDGVTDDADTIKGLGGSDTLFGASGNDTLIGGEGNDSVTGGLGADSISLGNGSDVAVWTIGDGNDNIDFGTGYDTLLAGGSAASDYFIFGPSTAAGFTLEEGGGAATVSVSGIDENDQFRIRPLGGSDYVVVRGDDSAGLYLVAIDFEADGVPDIAVVQGSTANNYIIVTGSIRRGLSVSGFGGEMGFQVGSADRTLDRVVVEGGEGNDVITGYQAFAFDQLEAGVMQVTFFGGNGNDQLIGGMGNETLDGGSGIDSMNGRLGDDTYVVDASSDLCVEAPGEGTDVILSSVNRSLSANIENLTLSGMANLVGNGNELANIVSGNGGNNVLRGYEGADTLVGAGGNDTLDGGAGNDTMIGGLGNDTYIDPTSGDVTTELGNGGTDTIESSTTFTLSGRQQVENLTLTGSANVNASGNSYANVLTGNAGNNILNGSTGADTMIGGAGNDTYYVDSASDQTIELSGQGTDIVSSSVSRTLSANIENLNLSGTANIDGNGNTGANVINGNSGNNILRGYEGSDTLNGREGVDILLGGAASDKLNPGNDGVLDIIRFSAVTESTGSQRDIVTGMDLNGEDVFDFTMTPASIAFVNTGTLSLASINADLAAAVNAALAVNGAVLFDPSAGNLDVAGHAFLVVDANSDGVYTANQDYVVQLINPTGTLTLDDFT